MDEMKTYQSREEIPLEHRWATEDLYPTDEAWEEDLVRLDEMKNDLVSFAGRLAENGTVLYDYLTVMEQADVLISRLANYAARKNDEDTRVARYQAMHGRFRSVMVKLGTECSFETPEIMAISDEALESFYAAEPRLERYRRYLTDSRRQKEHTLSAEQEKLLAASRGMSQNPSNVFGMFNNADLTFPDALDAQGKAHPVTGGSFVALQANPDRELRKNSFQSMYGTYAKFKNTSAAMLNGQMQQLKFYAEARKYPTTLDAALSRTNVPTEVYRNLIAAVHANMDKMHKYVRLRKKLMGVEELHFYDVYTDLVPGVSRYISIGEAKQTVYEAMAPLGEEYRAVLKEGFENRWIDVFETPGKVGGAYSAGAEVHPFVLLNHSGTLKSQFTLAHEMGHALHSWFSCKNQNPVDANYKIFVAEVASTCNEALLMEHLLKNTTDRAERAFLLNHFLEQFKGTLYRQTMFAEFELKMNEMVASGAPLTAERLCEEYRKINELYFGPDMVIDEGIAMEWARIPHFYYNYYVFQYATGYAAAIALSQQILTEGEPAVKRYLEFLSGGCSKSPVDLLKGAGVDMSSPEPINRALEKFGQIIDELDALMQEL